MSNLPFVPSSSYPEALNRPLPNGPAPPKPSRHNKIVSSLKKALEPTKPCESEPVVLRRGASPSGNGTALNRLTSGSRRRGRVLSVPKCVELNQCCRRYSLVIPRDKPVRGSTCVAAGGRRGSQRDPEATAPTLFEYCALVDYDMDRHRSYVKGVFPLQRRPHDLIETLVHPSGSAFVEDPSSQNFALILTDHSKRMYAFCRRVLPESSEFCIPVTYCLVTHHDEPYVFFQLLAHIESQHGNGRVPEMLLEQLYDRKMPEVGESLSLPLPTSFECADPPLGPSRNISAPLTWTVSRPKDSRTERTELYTVYQALSLAGLIEVFECLLLEKVVIVHSASLSLLTTCIQGLLRMLYPFQWQHVLVAVIPAHLQPMLEDPVGIMFVGTLQPVPEEVWSDYASNICYVDLDKPAVRPMPTKESRSFLPTRLKESLRRSLKRVKAYEGQPKLASVLIGDTFVRFFVTLLSNLDTYDYEKTHFLAQVECEDNKRFLDCFLDTDMFQHFVHEWHASKHDSACTSSSPDYRVFNEKILAMAPKDEIMINYKPNDHKDRSSFVRQVQGIMKSIRKTRDKV